VVRVRRRSCAAASALLLAGLILGGCGGDDDGPGAEGQGPSPSGTASPDSATSTDGTADTSPTPTSSSAPSVTPASGVELVEKTSAVRAPAGWEKDEGLSGYSSGASAPDGSGTLQLVDSADLGGGGSLEQLAQIAIDSLKDEYQVTRLPDVDLSGTPAFHLRYTDTGDPTVHDMVTTVRDGRNVGLDFVVMKRALEKQPELVDSVLVTFRWR
jgi:hypothetical protein